MNPAPATKGPNNVSSRPSALATAIRPAFDNVVPAHSRLPLVDAIRALLATTIAWHHFVLYGPLANLAPPELSGSFEWLRSYRWAVQPFFVVGGYVLARTMVPRRWDGRQVLAFVGRRYCRLGLPYLAAIALAIVACSLARGELPEEMIGPPLGYQQLLAHVFFLQDILGYPALSAGLWFVCIDFQLSLMLVAMLYLRDCRSDRRGPDRAFFATGWSLVMGSLFYFNLHPEYDVWGIYYFAHFFLGVVLAKAVGDSSKDSQFVWLLAVMSVAIVFHWRWRIVVAMLTGIALFIGAKTGLMTQWPTSRVIAYLGRTSYSLFLVHFPMLVVVETAWPKLGWTTPGESVAGLLTAYILSLAAADVFYRTIELPAWTVSQHCKWQANEAAAS